MIRKSGHRFSEKIMRKQNALHHMKSGRGPLILTASVQYSGHAKRLGLGPVEALTN